MGRDVFDKSGVSYGVEEKRQIRTDDSRLARITSQRRCAPAIWERVQRLYPEVANATNADLLHRLIQLEPSPGQSIVLLDTSGVDAKCERARGSWQNRLSADLALEVAATVAAEAPHPITIAIISPYRAQVRLLRQCIRGERKAKTTPYDKVELEAGTVHQFQGSDADVVIFDVVDGRGRNEVGKLLRDDAGIRLVNVAITRAKGKLIVIADGDWCRRVHIHNYNALLGELVLGYRVSKTLRVHQQPQPDPNLWPQRDKTESPIETALFDTIAKYSKLSTVRSQLLIRDITGQPVSRADFAFEEIKYAVYCDGRQWHLREDRWEHDLRQRNKLTELGWIFSVFTGRDITRNADVCAAQVLETYMARLESLMRHQASDAQEAP
jgi:very-short-patch-repair endonuclease